MYLFKITLHTTRNKSNKVRTEAYVWIRQEFWFFPLFLSAGKSLFVQRSGSEGGLNGSRPQLLLLRLADDAEKGRGAAA